MPSRWEPMEFVKFSAVTSDGKALDVQVVPLGEAFLAAFEEDDPAVSYVLLKVRTP